MGVKKVFVIGAGSMGSGIAQTFAQSGFQVYLYDVNKEGLDKALENIKKFISKDAEKGKYSESEKNGMLNNIQLCTDLAKVSKADLIIEAIVEDLDVKRSVFAEVSKLCKKDAILASNTSTISITSIASAVKEPKNFVGMHFFNPVPLMKLLEIVRGYETTDETIERVENIGKQLNKVTIIPKDSPGFLVNRIQAPMLNAAVNLLDSGVGTMEDIDKGIKFGCNYPMGPLELIDYVGLDIQLSTMEQLYKEFGEQYYKPAQLLKRMVNAGHLGRKTGRGFYDYVNKDSK